MQTLGEFLRKKREEQSLTLEQVTTETKVSPRMLKALEEDRLEKVPSEVFALGFVRAYARYLKLNPEEVLSRYRDQISAFYRQAEEEEMGGDSSREVVQPEWPKQLRAVLTGLGLVALVAAGVYGWIYWQQAAPGPHLNGVVRPSVVASDKDHLSGMIPPVPEDSELDSLELSVNLPQSDPAFPPGTMMEEEVPPEDRPAPPVSAQRDLTLVIEALEESWIVANIDGQGIKEVLLRPGEKVRWSAQERFVLTIGNAGGVRLVYNGEPLEILGESGKVVRNVVLSR